MEFLVRNFSDTNPDDYLDRSGCRKRGMVDAMFPDGHEWGRLESLPRFVIIKVPGLTAEDVQPYSGMRAPWRDRYDYEVTGQNANQGWYDIRVFETQVGASGQNTISGAKATKIQGFLQRWGCTRINIGSNEIAFRFDLWNAVRSVEFWDISAFILAQMTFELVSYVNGVGTIRVTVPLAANPDEVIGKITERGGAVTTANHPQYVFTIERSVIVQAFRQDVREKAEDDYLYQRYRFIQSLIDQAEATGGILTISRDTFLNSIADAMAV